MSLELPVCSRRRARRARRVIASTAGGLVLVVVLAFILPAALGLTRHTVTDDAMSGTVERGSVVFTESLPLADLEVGDVIAYRPPSTSGELITRRVADIDRGLIWTSSDSTGAIDPWTISADGSTQRRAVVDIPYVGHAYDALIAGASSLWRTVERIR